MRSFAHPEEAGCGSPPMPSRRPLVMLLRPVCEGLEYFEEFARVIHVPVLRLKPVPGSGLRVLELCRGGGWLVLTSANGVRMLVSQLGDRLGLLRSLQSSGVLSLAAVGPKTARVLEEYGLRVDLVPSEYRGEVLARELVRAGARRVVLARSENALPELRRGLEQAGVEVHEVKLYRVEADLQASILAVAYSVRADYIVYTSPSTVNALAEGWRMLHVDPRRLKAVHVAIGPTTARRLEELGLKPLYPSEYTMEAVAQLVWRHWSRGVA